MTRLIPALLAATLLASPVVAADAKKKEFCQINTDIIQRLVDMRLERVGKAKAVAELTKGENAVPENYQVAVTQWSDWIYGQPRRDAKKFVADEFYQACLTQ
ncbi:hypothetical protein [Shimia sp. SDUM112013]|uniref:hypothetical protein n=1 Tax=Shimia sp. SDUM112013 TaxID=3136160 RepID=UPI0032ED843E